MKGNTQHPRSSRAPFRSLILAVSLAPCFLAGCALTRAPRHLQVLAKSLPNSVNIPPVWSSNTNSDAVNNDWLKSFNDRKLDAVVAEAIQNNPNLRQAAATVEQARQTVALVGSQLLPQVGGQLNELGGSC
jgi:outer membrane protein TolC